MIGVSAKNISLLFPNLLPDCLCPARPMEKLVSIQMKLAH